jgi:hypothetical protein
MNQIANNIESGTQISLSKTNIVAKVSVLIAIISLLGFIFTFSGYSPLLWRTITLIVGIGYAAVAFLIFKRSYSSWFFAFCLFAFLILWLTAIAYLPLPSYITSNFIDKTTPEAGMGEDIFALLNLYLLIMLVLDRKNYFAAVDNKK